MLRNQLQNLAASSAALAFALIVAAAPSESHAAKGDCGQPATNGASPTATDCLFILRASVGSSTCDPTCICDVNGSGGGPVATDALICLNVVVGNPSLLNCDCPDTTTTTVTVTSTTSTTSEPPSSTTTSTTTTTTGNGGACPDTIELTLFAGTGPTCANNADCEVGTCDAGLSRCVTETELDTGWTGISHDADVNDNQTIYASLDCGVGNSAPCGVCDVTGITADNRTCRCANDNRAICDAPFVVDADDCGGNVCNCYLGPPLPLSAGNTPACIVNRLAEDVSGTVDVDLGSGASLVNLRSQVFLGDTIITPCPYCDGDVTPGDGVRDGTCVVGEDAGAACDVDAVNETFPAPGGDGHSLDCFPDQGKNVSGQGLIINLPLTTGAVSLDANISCPFSILQFQCQCGVCGNTCTTTADCTALGLGTCTAGKCSTRSIDPCSSDADCTGTATSCMNRGSGDPRPNQCAANGTCNAGPNGDGVCDQGPSDLSCDAVVRANGEGFIQCQSNADCAEGTIGIAAGNCTLTKARECFLPTIEAQGAPDPDTPLGAGVFCIGPTGNAGINSVAGLPGPGRVVNQGRTRKFCGGAGGNEYVTNTGCP